MNQWKTRRWKKTCTNINVLEKIEENYIRPSEYAKA
jgi:hypothetical protein